MYPDVLRSRRSGRSCKAFVFQAPYNARVFVLGDANKLMGEYLPYNHGWFRKSNPKKGFTSNIVLIRDNATVIFMRTYCSHFEIFLVVCTLTEPLNHPEIYLSNCL